MLHACININGYYLLQTVLFLFWLAGFVSTNTGDSMSFTESARTQPVSESQDYDFIIVGSGPAGSILVVAEFDDCVVGS